jgi:DNA-binding CsgD family transcriptional regulator
MVPDAVGHLVALGLKTDEAEVYRLLLTGGMSTVEQIVEKTGFPPKVVSACFTALSDAGLVSSAMLNQSSAIPIQPGLGLDLLSRRREAELTDARITVTRAFDAYRRSISGDPADHLIEVLRGPAVRDRIHQLETAAKIEVRGLDSPPYYADADANLVELDNLRNGVRYRAVYGRVALERPEYLADNVLPCGKAGEEARILPDVPVKLLIIDEECAVVSLSVAESDVCQSALLIRPCSLLSALIGLFEMCWRAALPLDFGSRAAGLHLLPSERRLLSLLAAGLGDDQVARSLGVSRRTVFRYLESLMERTGAANRFQLALHAKRNGWL